MQQLFSTKQLFFKLSLSVLFLVLLILFYSAWQNWVTLLSFAGAYLLGVAFLFADEQFLHTIYAEKIDERAKKDSHFPQLISRNSLFLLVLPLLSIFVLTSSGSVFGIALVLALNFYLLVEMWQLQAEFLLFKDRFLDSMRVQPTKKLTQKICLSVSSYFLFLLLILIF